MLLSLPSNKLHQDNIQNKVIFEDFKKYIYTIDIKI